MDNNIFWELRQKVIDAGYGDEIAERANRYAKLVSLMEKDEV